METAPPSQKMFRRTEEKSDSFATEGTLFSNVLPDTARTAPFVTPKTPLEKFEKVALEMEEDAFDPLSRMEEEFHAHILCVASSLPVVRMERERVEWRVVDCAVSVTESISNLPLTFMRDPYPSDVSKGVNAVSVMDKVTSSCTVMRHSY